MMPARYLSHVSQAGAAAAYIFFYLMFYTLIKNSGIRMQGASRLPNSTIYVVEAGYLGKCGPLGFPGH